MRIFLCGLLCFVVIIGFGQFQKPVALSVTGHFNFGVQGLYDDGGFGARLNATLFANRRVLALVEASADRLFGDKVLYLDENGNKLKSPVFYSLLLGPQVFVANKIALSASGGPVWHRIYDTRFTTDAALRGGASAFLSSKQRFVTNLSFTNIFRNETAIHFFSIGVGYRFL